MCIRDRTEAHRLVDLLAHVLANLNGRRRHGALGRPLACRHPHTAPEAHAAPPLRCTASAQ
eukprot:1908735-Prymnesium_polylepis.1